MEPIRAPSLTKGAIYFKMEFLVWAGEQMMMMSASDTTSEAELEQTSILPTKSPFGSHELPFVYAVIYLDHTSGLLVKRLTLKCGFK